MHPVSVLVFDGSQSLDVFGPVEVLHGAGGYDVRLVSAAGRAVLSNGVPVETAPLPGPGEPLGTLVVSGGTGARAAAGDPVVRDWVRTAAARADRVASVCTGAFVLAAAGVLDGRRATTHWRWCGSFARRHPDVAVEPDAIWVRDGDVWTSAGVTAGIDLALALVEEDRGPALALDVARHLVVFLKRPGGQSQFSGALAAQAASRPALRDLQAWIAANLEQDLSLATLAARAGMAERSFTRAFRREVGESPGAYVEALRVERARQLLQDGAPGLEAVARACGFASAEVLRRAFHRRVGVGPSTYRERFRLAA